MTSLSPLRDRVAASGRECHCIRLSPLCGPSGKRRQIRRLERLVGRRGAIEERRLMADVLAVEAVELGDPVADLVLVIRGDFALHVDLPQ